MDKQDIRQFSQDELRFFFVENNFPKYRANQVYEWIWKHYQLDFDLMSNLPIDLRELLKKRFVFNKIVFLFPLLRFLQRNMRGTIRQL